MNRLVGLTAVALLCLAACGGQPPNVEAKKASPPATVSNGGITEGDLGTVRLTPEAEQRLGIATARVESRVVRQSRAYSGECVVPPGQSITVAAPVAGTLTAVSATPGARVTKGTVLFRLSPFAGVQRDLRATVEAEVSVAKARLEGAQLRLKRAEQLLRDEVGSVRQKEQAEEEVRVAKAALDAAEVRLKQVERAPLDADTMISIPAPRDGIVRQLLVQEGQLTPAGAALAEIAQVDRLWIRVPVYAGEARSLDSRSPASVRSLNQSSGAPLFTAQPVAAPPSADPLASAVDLYYSATGLRPGERVSVDIPLRGQSEGLTAPWSSIVYDIHGNAWVYERQAPHIYHRRRVDPSRVAGDLALLAHGPAAGTEVVTEGVAELFGVEFGSGK